MEPGEGLQCTPARPPRPGPYALHVRVLCRPESPDHCRPLSSLQCERLVGLLLDTAVVSTPSSGGAQRNVVSFSHGQCFYNLFSETVNTELLRNLDLAVSELMKSSMGNPKMVMGFFS